MKHSKKRWIVAGIIVFLLFLILISIQVYQFNMIKNDQRELEKKMEIQNELTMLKINQTTTHVIKQIEEQQRLNEEQRLELEKKTLHNFERLEGYINQKTNKLQLDLDSQISNVDKQIKGLEEKDYEIENKVDSINVKSSDFSSIIQDVMQTVVSIKTNEVQGSGFFFSKEGYIMTNKHVIEGANKIYAIDYNSQVYEARLVGAAKNVDLAVLKITASKEFKYLRFEDDFKVGQRVIAVGNPLGLSFTVTEGIISAIERKIDNTGIGYIQTDVPINKGNSGGPLVNAAKKVVGINTFKISTGEGLGFAIPADVAEEIANQALESSSN